MMTLNINEQKFIDYINDYLDKLMNDIYIADKKSYLYYAKKYNELVLIYKDFLDLVNNKITREINKGKRKLIEPIALTTASLILSVGSISTNQPLFLLPCAFLFARASYSMKCTKEEFSQLDDMEPFFSIEKRFGTYSEVLHKIMDSYIYHEETNGYINTENISSPEELYKIANFFIAFLLHAPESIDTKYLKPEIIDEIFRIIQTDINSNENDLTLLLNEARDFVEYPVTTEFKTRTRKPVK